MPGHKIIDIRAIVRKYILNNTSWYEKLSCFGEVFGKIIDAIKLPGTNGLYPFTNQKIFMRNIVITSIEAATSIPKKMLPFNMLTADPIQIPLVNLILISEVLAIGLLYNFFCRSNRTLFLQYP